ncbi:GIN domain-containing protein [Sphingobium algorifonticola]|uniref:DUF2807 domain-containing protein n=1 Tax=Sphingobium algorifonticola TaxID=2008318 RepID=A0A437JA31_9SPHN|nr:DUF2807 domain-containing protein [Sphingobium algorifonticola]RVT42162.1 DUF2807 domain-containing protein [Sphingobium algorifonticola]
MIRAALIIAFAALPVPTLAATQTYTITRFDSVRLDAPIRVAITSGKGVTASGEGDREALDRIDMKVSGNSLVIRMKPRPSGQKGGGGPVTLRLSTDDVRRATLTGGGSLSIDRMKGTRGDIMLGGGGDLTIGAVALDQFNILLSGSGRVTVAGKAGRTDVRVSGPGTLSAEALTARDARLTNEGTGSIAITASATADVRAYGSGDVIVSGKAACTVVHNGAGRVLCGGDER